MMSMFTGKVHKELLGAALSLICGQGLQSIALAITKLYRNNKS